MYLNYKWDQVLYEYLKSSDFSNTLERLDIERRKYKVYPQCQDIFRAFRLTDFDNVKVVILGQDPYHQYGQANGLAFSVNKGISLPRSLNNIFKELSSDLGINNRSGDLSSWAKQGVLLLNSSLSVRDSLPNSHLYLKWSILTDEVIKIIGNKKKHIVFILWGNFARNKKKLIDLDKNLVIESAHPSPLSASKGFFGSKPFSTCNKYLKENDIGMIDWRTYEDNN